MAKQNSDAKASVDRMTKISSIYRDLQEVEKLEAQLDSAQALYDTPEKSKAFRTEINSKIKKAKAKLKTNSNSIINSGDKVLISEFKQELGKDKKLSKAVNYNPKSKTMPKKNKNKFEGKIPDYENRKAELEYLKSAGRTEEYNKKKDDLDKRVAASIYLKQKSKEDKFSKDIAAAEKNKDWTSASRLVDEQKEFDTNKIDFTKVTDDKTGFEYGGIEGQAAIDVHVPGEKKLDLDYDKIYESFEGGLKQEQEKTKEEDFRAIPDPSLRDQGISGGGSAVEKYVPRDVDDRGKGFNKAKFGQEISGEKRDWEGEWEKSKQDLAEYKDYQQEQFQHNYAPDSQPQGDLFGTLMDATRGVMGAIGAGKEVPTYERGSMFSEAMGDAERFKDQGLSSTERGYRERQAETGYQYDIKNIRRLAGGSAGVALGNLGRAQTQLQDRYSGIAAEDEATRRTNRLNFQNMSLRDETINRQIFQDELRQTEMTKQAGAGLVQDAVRNIQDRNDFNKQYGKGSAYYEYTKSKDRDVQESIFNREGAQARRSREGLRELEFNETTARKRFEDNNTLDGDKNSIIPIEEEKKNPMNILDEYSPEEITTKIDDRGNVFKRASSDLDTETSAQKARAKTNKGIAVKTATKKARADEIIKLMEQTDDMSELDKLDKELSSLKL